MLNVYEYTFLFLSFENVRSIFCFLVYVELKKDLKKTLQTQVALRPIVPFLWALTASNLIGH